MYTSIHGLTSVRTYTSINGLHIQWYTYTYNILHVIAILSVKSRRYLKKIWIKFAVYFHPYDDNLFRVLCPVVSQTAQNNSEIGRKAKRKIYSAQEARQSKRNINQPISHSVSWFSQFESNWSKSIRSDSSYLWHREPEARNFRASAKSMKPTRTKRKKNKRKKNKKNMPKTNPPPLNECK